VNRKVEAKHGKPNLLQMPMKGPILRFWSRVRPSRHLANYERKVLESLLERCNPRVQHLFRQQLSQIRYIQRLRKQPEVNFFARRRGGNWEEATLFPLRREFQLGRVAFRIGGQAHESNVYAVNGHVFALVTRPMVKTRSSAAVEILEIEPGTTDPLQVTSSSDSRSQFLPASYFHYLESIRTRFVNGWSVLEPSEAYEVADETCDVLVLAAGRNGRLLAGRVGQEAERYFVLDPGRKSRRLDCETFEQALRVTAGDDRTGSTN
jgi:hypothetical protein